MIHDAETVLGKERLRCRMIGHVHQYQPGMLILDFFLEAPQIGHGFFTKHTPEMTEKHHQDRAGKGQVPKTLVVLGSNMLKKR